MINRINSLGIHLTGGMRCREMAFIDQGVVKFVQILLSLLFIEICIKVGPRRETTVNTLRTKHIIYYYSIAPTPTVGKIMPFVVKLTIDFPKI